jgi:hypothetical protein
MYNNQKVETAQISYQLMNKLIKCCVSMQWDIIHTLRGIEYCYMVEHEWNLQTSQWKRPGIKGHIVYNSIYMKCQHWSIHRDRKSVSGVQVLGIRNMGGTGLQMGIKFLFFLGD